MIIINKLRSEFFSEYIEKMSEFSIMPVDKNIPENNTTHTNRYALIIGNEDYNSYQTGLNAEVNVAFARNDAKVFKQYCEKTLGVPSENITYLSDATEGKMKQGIDKINKLIKYSDGKFEIIFYYAGHGLPDEKTHDSYLISVDVSGVDLQSAIKLNDLYKALSEYPSERVTIFLDACFTGGGRNQGLIAARGVKVTPRADLISGNMVVFSASSGEQTSLPYKEKQHGMFTYFLLKKMQETKGETTYKELSDYLNRKVSLESVKINSKVQTPQINTSVDINNSWETWKMR